MPSILRTGGAPALGPPWRPCSSVLLAEPRVRTVRVTVSPGNVPSYQLASQYGFTEVGQQWDDEHGLEIIYEVYAQPCAASGPAARGLRSGPHRPLVAVR